MTLFFYALVFTRFLINCFSEIILFVLEIIYYFVVCVD